LSGFEATCSSGSRCPLGDGRDVHCRVRGRRWRIGSQKKARALRAQALARIWRYVSIKTLMRLTRCARPSFLHIHPPIPPAPMRHGHALRPSEPRNHHSVVSTGPRRTRFCSASRVTFVGSRMPLRACRRTHRSPRCSRRPLPASLVQMTPHPRRILNDISQGLFVERARIRCDRLILIGTL